jgi:arsenate reductase
MRFIGLGRGRDTAMTTVLFACVHNAGRSQLAAAIFNALVDPAKARAISAGTQPAERVHPEVLAVLEEIGIHLGKVKPQLLTEGLAGQAQLLVTMGCGESCPVVPGLTRMDWELVDPNGQTLQRVRAIRDDVMRHVTALIEQRDWRRST